MLIGRTDAELQSFGHLMQRTDSREKTLMLGKIEGRRPSEPPEKPLLYFLKLLSTSLEMLSNFHLTPVVLPALFHNGQVLL